MAESNNNKLEREYVIPLRKAWLKAPMYERTRKAINAIKIFLAKHMKVEDRDTNKVKIDVYLNNDLWFKGRTNPPAKIKVKAIKENGIVTVNFVEVPQHVRFLKAKHEKIQKANDSKAESKEEKKDIKSEKSDEEKKDEKEKEISVAKSNEKQMEVKTKEQKHTTKSEKAQRPVRMALKK